MAFNKLLANRIRERLANIEHLEEKTMMGGVVFMVNNKMCVGVIKDDMMCRIDPKLHEMLIEKPGCRTLDITKRRLMVGYVLVEEDAMRSKADFDYWINLCLDFNPQAKPSVKKKK